MKPTGFNVFGFVGSSAGLGGAARGTVDLLRGSRFPVSVSDIAMEGHAPAAPDALEELRPKPLRPMPYGTNVFHVQPDVLDALLAGRWFPLPTDHRMNTIVPFWELSDFPRPWMEQLRAVDVVLAPSRHIETAIARVAPDMPVIHYPQALPPLPPVAPDRDRWQFAAGDVVFLTAFDVTGDTRRKNPFASITAFREAFGADEPVTLVVRLKNADVDPRYAADVEALRQASREDARIRVIEGDLPYADLLGLYASADVLVSLHRAEGLGFVLMEAMALGTPVIATAWSGNMDFMTPENSALVGYDLVRAEGLHDYYSPELVGDSRWAEPRTGDAVRWMRALAHDGDLRRSMGERARHDVLGLMDSPARLAPFEELASLYESDSLRTERHRRAAAYVRERRRRGLANAFRKLRDPEAVRRALGGGGNG